MYSSMPKYVFRVIGEHASPERYANVNPITVMLTVVPITDLQKLSPNRFHCDCALGLIPISSLVIAVLPGIVGSSTSLHPVTLAMLIGISLGGLAECFPEPTLP